MSATGPAASETDAILALYERHAGRLYAVARRITGDDAIAAEVIGDIFVSIAGGGSPWERSEAELLRLTRDYALRRRVREPMTRAGAPSPRQLVEEAFFDGRDVADLARIHGMPEEEVRHALRHGMMELRDRARENRR